MLTNKPIARLTRRRVRFALAACHRPAVMEIFCHGK
jgi:hypothetical protein